MKLMHGTLLSALVALAALSAHAAHHASEKHSKPNLKNAVDQLMGAFEKESVEMFDDVMAKDTGMVTFGTDASERWVGFDEVRDSFANQIGAFEVERIDTRNQVIKQHIQSTHGSSSGSQSCSLIRLLPSAGRGFVQSSQTWTSGRRTQPSATATARPRQRAPRWR